MTHNVFFKSFIFTLLITLYLLLIYPSLFGTFELDDHEHLKNLNRIHDFFSLLKYTFYQFSTDGKRFISMLTFALQADSWPNPFNFKLFNLILHLINALLIYWLVYQLSRLRLDSKEAYLVSTGASILWLFAPIHIFSTFYVIQRMTLLCVFFTLMGCNLHIYLRSHLDFHKTHFKPYFLISLSILFFTLTGIFSKENGILLCLFILVIEAIFLKQPNTMYWKQWKLIFLWGPLLLLLFYLIINNRLISSATDLYPFSSWERLWNQSVILWQYIYIVVFPTTGAYSLINDDIDIIRQWSDWRVILSSIAHILIVFVSFKLRKSQPVLFFGICWFYGGHVLESTTIMLELYYEHRNYLPALGLYVIMAYYLLLAWKKSSSPIIKLIFLFSIICYFFINAIVLKNTAGAFSSEENLTLYQYQFHPDSRRTQIRLTNYLFNSGHHKEAAIVLKQMLSQWPNDISLHLYLLLASDVSPVFIMTENERFKHILTTGENTRALDVIVNDIFNCIVTDKCNDITHKKFREIISLMKSNKNLSAPKLYENLIVLESKSYSQEKNWQAAIETLQSLSDTQISRIEFYFILLQNQYMAKDFEASWKTISIIEAKIATNPAISLSLDKTIRKFKKHISVEEARIEESNNDQTIQHSNSSKE